MVIDKLVTSSTMVGIKLPTINLVVGTAFGFI